MHGQRLRLAVVLGVLALSSGVILWVSPQGAAQQQLICDFLIPQPAHPLEMNTVVSDPRTSQFRDPLIKHVVMEKETYECVENPDTQEQRSFTRDVETFIEIIQRVQGGRTTPVEKRVEEIVCDKGNGPFGSPSFGVECSARDVPLQEGPVTLGCSPDPNQRPEPQDPVEMDTVVTARQDTVKTFKVDKERFTCGGQGGFFGDLYLFTEIVETRAAAAGGVDTIRPTEKKFQAILCEVQRFPVLGRIASCHHFVPAGPPPA